MNDMDDSMDVDDLCTMLSAQALWCAEENYEALGAALLETRLLLQAYVEEDAVSHVTKTKARYRKYLHVIQDWDQYGYLVDNMKGFCSTNDTHCVGRDLLFVTYFIDSEILRFVDTSLAS